MNSNQLVILVGMPILVVSSLLACPSPNGGIVPAPVPPDVYEAAPPMPLPEASPIYDGSTTSDCYLACEALKQAGCKEGTGTCIVRLQKIQDLRTEQNLANGKLPLTCKDVEGVRTPADFRKMGQVCTVGDGG